MYDLRNHSWVNEPFAVSLFKSLYLDMHGLISETSIWLLAGSTRLFTIAHLVGQNVHHLSLQTAPQDNLGNQARTCRQSEHSLAASTQAATCYSFTFCMHSNTVDGNDTTGLSSFGLVLYWLVHHFCYKRRWTIPLACHFSGLYCICYCTVLL